MVSLKRPIIFTLLLLIVIPAQNAIALTYLPDEDVHYSGKQYYGPPGGDFGDWVTIEFAVYDNGGQQLIDYGLQFDVNFELPWAFDENDFIYAYQVIHNSPSTDPWDVFSIHGIGTDAIDGNENIGTVDDAAGGIEPKDKYSSADSSSAYWEFFDNDTPSTLVNGTHSYFLLLRSTHDYKPGTYGFQKPGGGETVVPNPEPGTLALFGLGSVLLLKKQRKK